MVVKNRAAMTDFYAQELRRMIIAHNRALQADLDAQRNSRFEDIPEDVYDSLRALTNEYIIESYKLWNEKFKDLMI